MLDGRQEVRRAPAVGARQLIRIMRPFCVFRAARTLYRTRAGRDQAEAGPYKFDIAAHGVKLGSFGCPHGGASTLARLDRTWVGVWLTL